MKSTENLMRLAIKFEKKAEMPKTVDVGASVKDALRAAKLWELPDVQSKLYPLLDKADDKTTFLQISMKIDTALNVSFRLSDVAPPNSISPNLVGLLQQTFSPAMKAALVAAKISIPLNNFEVVWLNIKS